MQQGRRIDDRFALETLAGSGGMGAVYRARDLLTGGLVALKLVHEGADMSRFEREGRLLAELEHPSIVRFVARGLDSTDGSAYIAMEWLDGEDLEAHLRRTGKLTPAATMTLGHRVAEALAFAHARGVVHRDVKPANLFLVGGELERVKLVDFGIAFGASATYTGTAIGTPAYMAPEQARGERSVGPCADVFSLGCVLFECLAGRPVFVGEHVIAVLAKVLFEEAPRASDVVAGVPASLDELLARMLAKDSSGRPTDGAAVACQLQVQASTTSANAPVASATLKLSNRYHPNSGTRQLDALSVSEQRLQSVMMISPGRALGDSETVAATADPSLILQAVFGSLPDTHVEQLFDGTIILTLPGLGAATDQAAQAARFALTVHASLPDAQIALATGREGDGRSVGDAIDRAARLIRDAQGRMEAALPCVRIDAVTAGLLDERFQRVEDAEGFRLLGWAEPDAARTLLGKPAPCVGREAELTTLDALLAQCTAEPIARAVIVTAAAGIGKSRLRYELLCAARRRPENIEVWMARGDPIGAGSAWGLGAQLVRHAAGVIDGEPLETRRLKLRARVGRFVPASEAARVADYLGEMIGTPFATTETDGNAQLKAARADPIVMGDQIRRAWEDFVGAESTACPLLILIEDLHWGDLPTVKLLDSALRLFPEQPLMVVAFARPEVDAIFPELWRDRDAQRIALAPLSRRASERLARTVLGPQVAAERITRLVEQAGGNAFFLEELIRFEAEGGGDALPETVLAMVETRLAALEPETRRLLRAASVFGQTFWASGALTLFGGARYREDVERRLADLLRREIVIAAASSRVSGETEYVFRHGAVREAAYAMLTDSDRALGHRLAADWLEAAGESDAMVLAEHLDRGNAAARAASAFARAAEQALEGNDFAAAVARAERGVSVGAQREVLGNLRRIQAEAHHWTGANEEAARAAAEAIRLLPHGQDGWGDAAGHLATASFRSGDAHGLEAIAQKILDVVRTDLPSAGSLRAAARTAGNLFSAGQRDAAAALLAVLEAAMAASSVDATVRARLERARSTRALHAGDPAGYLEHNAAVATWFAEAGDARNACMAQGNVGYGLLELGAFIEAEAVLRAALAAADRMGLANIAAAAKQNLGWALARQGRRGEASSIEREVIEAFHSQGNRGMEGASRIYLAEILRVTGDLPGAEAEASHARGLLATTPPLQAHALAVLARVLVDRARVDQGLGVAREAMLVVDSGGVGEGEGFIRLAHAEAAEAAGEHDEARRAIATAQERLRARGGTITDERRRKSFLEAVPEHARTLKLAAAWLDPQRTARATTGL